jgi:hypothetical protein
MTPPECPIAHAHQPANVGMTHDGTATAPNTWPRTPSACDAREQSAECPAPSSTTGNPTEATTRSSGTQRTTKPCARTVTTQTCSATKRAGETSIADAPKTEARLTLTTTGKNMEYRTKNCPTCGSRFSYKPLFACSLK